MAQFDVYKNSNGATSDIFPYFLDVQNDLLSSLQTRVVVPLAVRVTPVRHLNPIFLIEEQMVVMSTVDMAGIPLSVCDEVVTNLAHERNDIIDALDFLVNGF
ncbi:CcdB family protein [bacterium]|nr:CcdB family protein [bacterium]MBU1959247.1 CcdB family protein [bacterium]